MYAGKFSQKEDSCTIFRPTLLYLIPIPFIYHCKHEFINSCERKKNIKQINEIIAVPLQTCKGNKCKNIHEN